MPLVNITQQATSLEGFQLSSIEDMIVAFQWLRDRGYATNIAHSPSNNADTLWLQKGALNATAGLTDIIVLENGATVRHIITPAEFAALYQVT